MEKIQRKISRTHWIALVISSLLFFVGLLMGLQLSYYGMTEVGMGFDELKNDEYIMQIIMLMDESDNASCDFYRMRVNEFNDETYEFGKMLDRAENAKGKGDPEVMQLKASYALMEFWDSLMLKQVEKRCNVSYVIVYYIYSNEDDYDPRRNQGDVLTMAKRDNPSTVMVYSFDISAKSPIIDLLRDKHNVTSVPAMIINDEKYEGFRNYDELKAVIEEELK